MWSSSVYVVRIRMSVSRRVSCRRLLLIIMCRRRLLRLRRLHRRFRRSWVRLRRVIVISMCRRVIITFISVSVFVLLCCV